VNCICFAGYDGNGNVAALVSAASGAVSALYEYGPFGEVIRKTGVMGTPNPFRFSTKYQDDETDLLYYGYRYYNPSTGRWTGRDPAGEEACPGVYAYVDNHPVDAVDCLGEWITSVHYWFTAFEAEGAGFVPNYAGIIGAADDGLDSLSSGHSYFPWPLGQQDRHMPG
jgi:RHS repeat-associated protein